MKFATQISPLLNYVWFLGLVEVLGSNEWVANPLGPGQTSALHISSKLLHIMVQTSNSLLFK